ncbi:hypothetical protein ACQ4M4_12855 [Leptolyngbya sp. AN02str]|uniref:hypothetical protein n=1 Tax=Leptolyngbya sp. AN02str TaxID=3423363 RepID=UPI003D3118DF
MRRFLRSRQPLQFHKGGSGSGGGGGGGSGGGGGGAEAPAPVAVEPEPNDRVAGGGRLGENVQLTGDFEGVSVFNSQNGNKRVYTFRAGDKPVQLEINKNGDSHNVVFTVAGRLSTNNSLSDGESAVAVRRLQRIIREDAKTRPEGFRYDTSAADGDRRGMVRAVAYESVGFSVPVNGQVGNTQYGVVRNGKLTPDNTRLNAVQRISGFNSEEAASNWAAVQQSRDSARNRRRQTNQRQERIRQTANRRRNNG